MLARAGGDGAGDEDEDAALGPRGLAVDGVDLVLALLEGERSELASDGGGAAELLALEGEHGAVLVQPHKRGAVGVERLVVVLHERLRDRIGIDPDPVVFLENELLYVISCPTQLFSLHLSCNISKSCILLYSYGESFPIKAEVLDSSFSVPIGKAKVCSLAAGKSLVLLGILYGLPGRAYFCCLHFYC